MTGEQVSWLANEIHQEWSAQDFTMFVRDELDIDASKLAGRDLKEQVVELVSELMKPIPTRDDELLEKLATAGTRKLREVAQKLLRVDYFSPTSDPHDAILLGAEAFVDRRELRDKLRAFTNPTPYTTRVLIVRGEQPCGKSYSWNFLRHLSASGSIGAKALHVQLARLAEPDFTPRQLFEYLFSRLNLCLSALPPMLDDPQHARVEPLVGAFMGQVQNLRKRYWLVIDDINDRDVTPEIREAVFAIASSVQDDRTENLWVFLLGYNSLISDENLRRRVVDDARFPDAELVAEHLKLIADTHGAPLPLEQALDYATVAFKKFPVLNKAAMISLTGVIEDIGEKLKAGMRP